MKKLANVIIVFLLFTAALINVNASDIDSSLRLNISDHLKLLDKNYTFDNATVTVKDNIISIDSSVLSSNLNINLEFEYYNFLGQNIVNITDVNGSSSSSTVVRIGNNAEYYSITVASTDIDKDISFAIVGFENEIRLIVKSNTHRSFKIDIYKVIADIPSDSETDSDTQTTIYHYILGSLGLIAGLMAARAFSFWKW